MEPDTSLERLRQSNEQMFKSIRAFMERLEEEVSDMAETLEALQQERIMDSPKEMI